MVLGAGLQFLEQVRGRGDALRYRGVLLLGAVGPPCHRIGSRPGHFVPFEGQLVGIDGFGVEFHVRRNGEFFQFGLAVVDFSFTRDSVMVLMHDLTIDRTTTGKGRVADYTYAELQQFCLVDRDRNVTPYKIPRLKDLLEWGKDKVVFNFDNKYINTRGVSDEVRRASLDYYIKQLQPGGDWSMYHNIMLSVRSVEEALYYWEHGIRNVMFCVEISSMEHFRAYDASPIPWKYIMAYIRLAVNPDLQPVYDLLHAEGVMTMTSITGSSDKVKNPYDRRVAYLRELVAEPDIIETDYPSEFIGLPWSRDAIHALQEAAMRSHRTNLK